MDLWGPQLLRQISDLRGRVIETGRRRGVSGRQMARLAGVQEKRVRSYLEDPAWREDTVDLLIRMEEALGRLGLLDPCAAPVYAQAMGRVRRVGGHAKLHLDRAAIHLDDQIRLVDIYLQAAASGGIIRECDLKIGYLRSRAPDCAVHLYTIESGDRIVVADWRPVADYLRGQDITGADIDRDFPPTMAACIREDVTAALRAPSQPRYTLVRRAFAQGETEIPNRCFLRLLQYVVGNGDVPKIVVARRLQPAQAAQQYFGDL